MDFIFQEPKEIFKLLKKYFHLKDLDPMMAMEGGKRLKLLQFALDNSQLNAHLWLTVK